MFDIMAAAFAATAPGPDLAESPGLKPKKRELSCVLGEGARALWQGWRVEVHFSLWGVRASVALLLTVVGPGLAVLGVGKGVDSPAPSPSLSALGPQQEVLPP